MAFTVSQITNSVFGNMRVVFLNMTTDAAEGAITVPGISRIVSVQYNRIAGTASFSTATCVENAGTTGTVAAGSLGFSAVVNGAIYRVSVFGV
jgi:hypothetical protein